MKPFSCIVIYFNILENNRKNINNNDKKEKKRKEFVKLKLLIYAL
jgi:hypothetical protein